MIIDIMRDILESSECRGRHSTSDFYIRVFFFEILFFSEETDYPPRFNEFFTI